MKLIIEVNILVYIKIKALKYLHLVCLFVISYFGRVNGGCFCDHIFFKSIYRRDKKKSTPLVMNNSNLESQTVALVVTGRS